MSNEGISPTSVIREILQIKAAVFVLRDQILDERQKEEFQKLYQKKYSDLVEHLLRDYPDLLLSDDELRDALGEDLP